MFYGLKPVNLIVWIIAPAVILFLFYYYPSCIFYRLTGLFCPGCGLRRAISALLYGNWREAAGYNFLLIAVVAERLVYLVLAGFRGSRLQLPGTWYYRLLFISALCFGILRNIPVEPFNWLAP
jgi:hypothetical protein